MNILRTGLRQLSGRLTPDFVIVGTQRGGTTSLFAYLCEHPLVLAPVTKELHYFDVYYRRGWAWYLANFPTRYDRWVNNRSCITGEGSPYYMFHPHSMQCIAKALPRVKIITLLRNPVDRAYSHFRMLQAGGYEELSFDEAIAMEEERLTGEHERLVADEHYRGFKYQQYSYLARGLYYDQVRRIYELFPRDRVLVVRSEDLYTDSVATFGKILDFLNLPSYTPKAFNKHAAVKSSLQPSVQGETRQRLLEHFRPHNEKLYEFLNRDFAWNT